MNASCDRNDLLARQHAGVSELLINPLPQRGPDAPDHNLIGGLAPDTRIYHFLRLPHFLELVVNERLRLSAPRSWWGVDSNEDLLCKWLADNDGEALSLADLTKWFRCQCWTLNGDDDGFEKFCSNGLGVRIETTAGRLIRAAWDPSDRHCHYHRFLGPARYLTVGEIKSEYEDCHLYPHRLLDQSNEGCAQALLVKTTEYQWEQEVRLLVEDRNATGDHIHVTICARELILGVKCAPTMSYIEFRAVKNQLTAKGLESILNS